MDLVAVHAYLRATIQTWRDCERIGPFLASFSGSSDNPFLNYAIPDDGACPTGVDVTGLIAAYANRGLKPRLEYLPDLAPLVEPVLLTWGFQPEGRLALMEFCGAFPTEPPAEFELVVPASADEFLAVRTVQHLAYQSPRPPGDREVESLRRNLDAGGGAVLVRTSDGARSPVGAGEYTPIIGGVTELTSVGVVADYRRRGLGAAIASWLVRAASAAGAASPFLMANEAEARIYARVGFRTAAEILHISK